MHATKLIARWMVPLASIHEPQPLLHTGGSRILAPHIGLEHLASELGSAMRQPTGC